MRVTLEVQLATADMAVISSNPSSVPTSDDIANYHADIFQQDGIPLTAWGGSAAAAMGLDWSQGTLTSAEMSSDLSQNFFAQNFTPSDVETSLGQLEVSGFESLGSGSLMLN